VKTNFLTIRLTDDMKEKVAKLADSSHRRLADEARFLIELGLRENMATESGQAKELREAMEAAK
jgi:predicted transcriptional regulator